MGDAGGAVRFREEVTALERDGAGWTVRTRRGEHRARRVVANVLPQALERLGGVRPAGADQVEEGWGACMLYAVPADDAPPGHVQIVQDPTAPLVAGNHLFASRGETITVSTHVPMSPRPDAARIEAIQRRMREGLRRFAPEWTIAEEFTASPRTFERWTRRPGGFVGGVPRRAGLRHSLGQYLRFAPPEPARGLHLVGDSFFPGQRTLATALGGVKLAERLAR